MAYQYTLFDDIALPLYNHSQDHDPMAADPALLDSIGGVFDWRGTTRQHGRRQAITLQGLYFGETEYLTDETGVRLVDESGGYLLAGYAVDSLKSQVAALMDKQGTRGTLWRKRLSDDVLEWKTARLLTVNWPRRWEDHAIKADLRLQFETAMEFWHAATQTTASANVVAGVAYSLTVEATGETADDAVLTVTRTSGTITAVRFLQADLGIDLNWTGSLGSGQVLTIDCGAQTVPVGAVDQYAGLSLGAGHTAAGWCPLSPGTYTFTVTVTGGNATVQIAHYNQFA